MSTEPGPDERRIRHLMDQQARARAYERRPAITPTRIIPAGVPLPARPPTPDDVPPWRAPAPEGQSPPPENPPAPPTDPEPEPERPGTIEVRIAYDPYPITPDPEPSLWDRITRIAPGWKLLAAVLGAMLPIPGVGYSLATVWAYTVTQARTEFGPGWAYALALTPLALAARAVRRTRSLLALFALVIALIGLTGAIHWFDPIAALTGVRPR
ncbi:hypothetical protein ACWEFL_02710 [Streptomyces sp. NPDC004838]